MDFPLASVVSVVASCAAGASCPWWTGDGDGPSWLFIFGCIIVFAALIVLLNRFGDRS
jgi:hypothetical protein